MNTLKKLLSLPALVTKLNDTLVERTNPAIAALSERLESASRVESSAPPDSEDATPFINAFQAIASKWPLLRTPNTELIPNEFLHVPERRYIERIVGRTEASRPDFAKRFLDSGFKDLKAFINVAEVYGLQLNEKSQILDWGIGCGRIARHLPNSLHAHFTGCDVDPINIQWCQRHIPYGTFITLSTRAESVSALGSYDLIYSHSVLTHLSETDQHDWLRVLARSLKPSGLALLTVHGLSHTHIADWPKRIPNLLRWLQSGFIDAPSPNPDISDVTDKNYYRDVAHSPHYIMREWSKHFCIIDIIPGAIGGTQDIIVCRSK